MKAVTTVKPSKLSTEHRRLFASPDFALSFASRAAAKGVPLSKEDTYRLVDEIRDELLDDDADIAHHIENVKRGKPKKTVDPDLICRRCRERQCVTMQKFDRLGTDEGATKYIVCMACNHRERS